MHARSIAVRAAIVVCSALGAGPSLSQLKIDPSVWSHPGDSVMLRHEDAVDLHTTPDRDGVPMDPYAYRRGLFTSLGLYEYKRIGELPGQYVKPHYAVGLHSELMRSALALTGLEAEDCIAPMLRLRARTTAISGATNVSMTVLARCSFH